MFSPWVSSPLMCIPGAARIRNTASRSRPERSLYFAADSGVHQSRRLPVGIVLPALIVEAVRHLVADDRADAAVVDRVVRLRIEERRLQNAGREHDLVHVRIVVGVHGRRRHAPFGAIDRFADLLQLAVRFRTCRARMTFST